jgi:hypothetical protein
MNWHVAIYNNEIIFLPNYMMSRDNQLLVK